MILGKWIAPLSLAGLVLALAGCGGGKAGQPVSASHYAFATVPSLNRIAALRIDSFTGATTTVVGGPFLAGTSPTSIVLAPSGNFAYVANQGGNDLSLLKIDHSTGVLTEVMPRTPAGVTPVYLLMDSSGQYLYVANQSSNTISSYSVNSGSGALTAVSGSPFGANNSPIAIALSPDGKFLFAANVNLGTVSVFSVNTGALQQVSGSPFPVGNRPVALGVEPNGNFLYVLNSLDSTMSVMAIDTTTGALTEISGSPFATGTNPSALVFGPNDPNQLNLYVTNQGSNSISVFDLDTGTGIPTGLDKSPFLLAAQPIAIALDSTGKFLLVSSQSNKSVNLLKFTSTGGLVSGFNTSVGWPPTSIVTTK